ncbi:LLM class flavin-dependent oxidoreductase, partial [Microbacterium sp. K41]|uniref:LLM class flavin-dependent oxidoreductase n=1 Tax=Microbacterium sp. K41 TaxID=2305437 RepID=UPI00109CB331
MTEPLVIGAMVRTLGAYPSGWRHPGAHRDPARDADVLRRIAAAGEEAGLDYLFFGDWLATGPDLEFRDPYLLARIDPVSAVLFLAGLTSRIGLIATVNTTYADPYTTARALASLDVLSGGRAGVNLVTGAEPRAAGNHGREAHADNETRYDRAEEFVTALRRLWDSWDADAWIADAERGVLIDADRLRAANLEGAHVRVTGPLNVARPPQGRIPVVHAGTSPRS